MHMCGGKHRKARSHSWLSSLTPFTLIFRGSLVETDARRLPSLADQQALGICLSTTPALGLQEWHRLQESACLALPAPQLEE